MYVSATKAQAEGIIGQIAVNASVYSVVLTNVTMIGLATASGWVGIAVAGIFSETDLLAALPSAVKVNGIVLS